MILSKILLSLLPLLAEGRNVFQKQQSNMTSSSSSSYHVEVDGSLYKIENGDLIDHEALGKAMGAPVSRVVSFVDTDTRQREIWDFISTFDSYKTSSSYKTNNIGKPTLENFKYVIVPIWWSDVDTTDSRYIMDPNEVIDSFQPNQQYYIDMSWGEMPNGVTYEAFEQQLSDVSSVSPSWDDTEAFAQRYVDGQGYIKDVDYTGVCIMYYTSQDGPFSGAGGWGGVNGVTLWSTYPGWFDVTRHEVGHNFGHPHHLSVSYEYRNTRPSEGEGTVPYDGFDMMSGGNGYDISHIAAASKWFWNWIPDSSIILMQPEGSTTECPSCSNSGSFKLYPFDDKDVKPSSSKKMGIHIPVVKAGNRLYSYWLSYRIGNDGDAANGLSVHLSWFDLGGHFGASYNSRNFDAFGDTDTTLDSFVVENTCYHLTPPGYMKDKGLIASLLVQPVVCVGSIDTGSSIDVTVSFLDIDNPPSPKISFDQEIELTCGKSSNVSLNANNYNLIHVKNTGDAGEVELNMCASSGGAKAYFYDDYPHSAVSYGSEAAYGSYKSLTSGRCSMGKDSLKYKSDYGQTYILIPPSSGASTIDVEVNCAFTSCLANQYKTNGECVQCPNNGHSDPGSTSLSDCVECPGGSFLPHPLSKQCAVLTTYEEITSATGWRIWAPEFDTYSGWALDIAEIEFYNNLDCSGASIDTSQGTAIDSGNAHPSGWGPQNAFDGREGSVWGGRPDEDGIFHIGMDFGNNMKQVRCVKLHTRDKYLLIARIQAYVDGKWKNAWIEDKLSPGINTISMDYVSQPTPTPPTPTASPTQTPQTPTSNSCQDSKAKFAWGNNKRKNCKFLKKKTIQRCRRSQEARDSCPVTCNTGCICFDTDGTFKNNKTCAYVNEKPIKRCKKNVFYVNCPKVCGAC